MAVGDIIPHNTGTLSYNDRAGIPTECRRIYVDFRFFMLLRPFDLRAVLLLHRQLRLGFDLSASHASVISSAVQKWLLAPF